MHGPSLVWRRETSFCDGQAAHRRLLACEGSSWKECRGLWRLTLAWAGRLALELHGRWGCRGGRRCGCQEARGSFCRVGVCGGPSLLCRPLGSKYPAVFLLRAGCFLGISQASC